MTTITVTKCGKRLAQLSNGHVIDIFCNGGKSSEEFHRADIGKRVQITVYKIDESRIFSDMILYSIQ